MNEFVLEIKNGSPAALGKLSDKRATAVVQAVFRTVRAQIDATESGEVLIPGLGKFVVRNQPVPGRKEQGPQRRVVFRMARPVKGKAKLPRKPPAD